MYNSEMGLVSKNKGLGKGFDALIPTDFDASILEVTSEKVQKVKHQLVEPNLDQPRKHFDETALNELASSIKQYGIVQPLVVTKKNDKFILIAGERRWRAAKIAGLKEVPVLVRSHEELEQLEIAIVENVQRVDLSPLEQAASIERLHDQFSMTYESIAKRLGKAPATVNNIVRLLNLPDSAKKALFESKISEGHARAILALRGDSQKQQELLTSIISNGWSVRQAEQFVVTAKQGSSGPKEAKAKMATTTKETKQLGAYLKTPVSIRRTAKGGRLELHFSSDEDLARIISLLRKIN